jgi:hypothetical protein
LRDGRIDGRLSAGLGLLTVTIDVVLIIVQAEGAKLNGCAVNLIAVARHPHRFFLLKHASLVARCPYRRPFCGLECRGRIAARDGLLVLLLRTGKRRGSRANVGAPRGPRVSSLTCCGFRRWRLRHVFDLIEVRLCELVVRGGKSDFRYSDGRVVGNGGRGLLCLSRLLLGSGGVLLRFGFVSGRFGGRERFDDGFGRVGSRGLLGLG